MTTDQPTVGCTTPCIACMTDESHDPQPATCPGCQHKPHAPGAECEAGVDHGPKRWHRCLCLNQAPSNTACHPLMDCQGGHLGYSDIWYLQRGQTLQSADGPVTPAVLSTLKLSASETEEERADRGETEREHAAGLHMHCGLTCEVDLPTEQIKSFVIAKGYPGTRAMLDELLRRAREERPLSPFYEHPACGFHWHGRDGMDVPIHDGQPVCPRCELRTVRDAIERVRAVLETAPVVGRSALEYRGLIAAALMADEAQQAEEPRP